jgi:hypothetical protein
VSVTLTPPIRVAALVGALVATGLVAFVFVMGRGVSESGTSTPVGPAAKSAPEQATTPHKPNRPRASAPRVVVTKSGFPAPVDRALRRRGVAVVAVYMPRAPVDALVRTEARAAAIESRVGFVAISALSERLVSLLVAKTGVLPAPSVLVIKRPGIVTATLGVTDRETIAQAVAQARR